MGAVLFVSGLCKVWLEGQLGHDRSVCGVVLPAGKSLRCILDVFAAHFRVDLWASAGGNGDRRHSVYRDLPDVSAALQYSAGHCGDCRTGRDGNPVGKMRP